MVNAIDDAVLNESLSAVMDGRATPSDWARVSAAWDGKTVSGVEILSERGRSASLVNPWPNNKVRVHRVGGGQDVTVRHKGEIAEFETRPGERYQIQAG